MNYAIEFGARAARDFRKLSRDVQTRLRPQIDSLATDPRPHGVEKLSGTENGYRIRVGSYRILYEIQDDVLTIYVVRVAHRREAYR